MEGFQFTEPVRSDGDGAGVFNCEDRPTGLIVYSCLHGELYEKLDVGFLKEAFFFVGFDGFGFGFGFKCDRGSFPYYVIFFQCS